jgi:hypothetical protein
VVFHKDQSLVLFCFNIRFDRSAVDKIKLLLYADDSRIMVSDKCKADVEYALQEDLHLVSHWLVDNKISLHLGKIVSILLGCKQKLPVSHNI